MGTEMEKTALIEGLKRLVIKDCNVKNVTPAQIGDEDVIIGGTGLLRLDSLDAVEIVTSLERHFDIRFESAGESRKIFHSFKAMADHVVRMARPERVTTFSQPYIIQ